MTALQATLPSAVSSSPSLKLVFYGVGVGSVLYPNFNDGFIFSWNPTTPYSTIPWSRYFGDPLTPLPSDYLNVVVMNNTSSNIWAWPTTSGSTMNTFPVPTGYLTLYGLLNAMYTASQSSITSVQYQDITGFSYTGNGTPTVATALTDFATSLAYVPQLQWITQESQTVLRILC